MARRIRADLTLPFRSFAQGLDAARQISGRNDLAVQHLMVLMEVIDCAITGANRKPGDPLPKRGAKDIAQAWSLTQDGISKILKSLESNGFIVSVIDKKDRRNRLYYPSELGRDFAIRWARQTSGTDLTNFPMEVARVREQTEAMVLAAAAE